MNLLAATSLDYLWRSPAFPMWLTLAAACFFGILVLITLVRAEKSVANGALTVIALLAVGIAVAATIRGYGPPSASRGGPAETQTSTVAPAAFPALSCLDDLAGDVVLAACEKAVFASAESTAAAASYVASQITRLTSLGDVTAAAERMTPELQALRRSIEHDRYGLVAQVLQSRDHCTPTECTVFRSLTDNHQIITNMDDHIFEGLVTRYSAIWNAPPTVTAAASPITGALAGLPPSVPTGKPTNADFPSAASTPAVSIMSPEPGTGTPARPPSPPPASASASASRPSPSPTQTPAAAAKKASPKASRASPGPTLLSPGTPAPAASND